MSIVFDSIDIKGLRLAHFKQLEAYLEQRETDGNWYYGNKKQFEKRHGELSKWLYEIINYIESEGVIIPKK